MPTPEQYLIVDLETGQAWFDGQRLLVRLLREGRHVVAISWTRAFEAFRKIQPDTSKLFDIDEIATVTNMTRAGVHRWNEQGVALPDAQPRAGRGVRRLWSWKGAFLAGTLASLARQRVPVAFLAKITEEMQKVKGRSSPQPV